jgi:hypothetical protein
MVGAAMPLSQHILPDLFKNSLTFGRSWESERSARTIDRPSPETLSYLKREVIRRRKHLVGVVIHRALDQ